MSDLNIQSGHMPDGPLPDMPIEPQAITQGNPVARGVFSHQSCDKKITSGFWTCSEGKFDATFEWDEFIYLLDGHMTITEDGGKTHTLRAGDTAHFPLGLTSHWHVIEPVKKSFVLRTPEPLEV